jgi:hypothetical protein
MAWPDERASREPLDARSWQQLAALCALLLLSLVAPSSPVAAQGEATPAVPSALNHAALIVDYGEGQVYTACVAFAEEHIPGVELLRRTGLKLVTERHALGEAVCKIEDVGCDYPGQHCFCECLSAPCVYWNYWYQQEGEWVYSGMGGSGRSVGDGGVEAWLWGEGRTQPGEYNSRSICAAADPVTDMPEPETAPTTTPTPASTGQATAAPQPTEPDGVAMAVETPGAGAPATSAPSGTVSREGRQDYAAFGAIVAVLLALVGYAWFVQRRRARLGGGSKGGGSPYG